MRSRLTIAALLAGVSCSHAQSPASEKPLASVAPEQTSSTDTVVQPETSAPAPAAPAAPPPQADPVAEVESISGDQMRARLDPLLSNCGIDLPWRAFEEIDAVQFDVEDQHGRMRYSGRVRDPAIVVDVQFDHSSCEGHVLVLEGSIAVQWRFLALGTSPRDPMPALQEGIGTSNLVWRGEASEGTRAIHDALGPPGCRGKGRASRSRKGPSRGDFAVRSASAGKPTKATLPSLVPSIAKTCQTRGKAASGWVALGLMEDVVPSEQSSDLHTWIRYGPWINQTVIALPKAGGVRLALMPASGSWEQRGSTPSGLRWGVTKDPGLRGHGSVPVVVDLKCGRVHAMSADPLDFTIDGDGAVTQPEPCPASDPTSQCRSVEVLGSRLTQRDCVGSTCSLPTIDLDDVAKRGCR